MKRRGERAIDLQARRVIFEFAILRMPVSTAAFGVERAPQGSRATRSGSPEGQRCEAFCRCALRCFVAWDLCPERAI